MSSLTKWIGPAAVITALAAVVACGPKPGAMPALGPAKTNAILAGPLCSGELCRCREEATGKFVAGEPDPGLKRYEVRVGPIGNDLRVSVGPHQIYKSNERPTECFYIDLPPGKHRVGIRAHGEPSFGAAVSISELARGKHWYRTFEFTCGSNVCSIEDLKEWRAEQARLGAKKDPCGSTKVTEISYTTGRPPDGLHPADLFVGATLDVYDFVPEKPSCAP